MSLAFSSLASASRPRPVRLTEADAIDIWIARWMKLRRKDVVARYACDPRRIYEVWTGTRFPAARDKAWKQFNERFPGLGDRVDASPHRTIHRGHDPNQLPLL